MARCKINYFFLYIIFNINRGTVSTSIPIANKKKNKYIFFTISLYVYIYAINAKSKENLSFHKNEFLRIKYRINISLPSLLTERF